MKKKHIITIAGKPGSGKSSTSKAIATALKYKHFSSGDFFRSIGKKRGIDVLQTNLIAEKEREIDKLVDKHLQELGSKEDHMVIDSRMAWHWMPYSFRVYLDLDLNIAAKRILECLDETRIALEEIPPSPDEYAIKLQERLESETRRYMSLYNVNPYDHTNYDLVVDTSRHTPEEVRDIILGKYQEWVS